MLRVCVSNAGQETHAMRLWRLPMMHDAREMCRGSLPALARLPHRDKSAQHAAIRPCSARAHKQGSAGAPHVLRDGDEADADEREEAAAVPAGSGEGGGQILVSDTTGIN
jgi:hypothetical protein